MHIYTFILIMVYEVNLHRSPSNLRPYSARKAPVLLPHPFRILAIAVKPREAAILTLTN